MNPSIYTHVWPKTCVCVTTMWQRWSKRVRSTAHLWNRVLHVDFFVLEKQYNSNNCCVTIHNEAYLCFKGNGSRPCQQKCPCSITEPPHTLIIGIGMCIFLSYVTLLYLVDWLTIFKQVAKLLVCEDVSLLCVLCDRKIMMFLTDSNTEYAIWRHHFGLCHVTAAMAFHCFFDIHQNKSEMY